MKEKIARFMAWYLPPRVMFWTVIRAYSDATTGKYSKDHVDSITYKKLHDRIKEKYGI